MSMSQNTNPGTLDRWLRVSPLPRSYGDPSGRLSFEPDRDVFWATSEGGEKSAAKGDATIRDHVSKGQFGRQGMLFPPQSIEEYRNTPERVRAVEDIAKNATDYEMHEVFGRHYPHQGAKGPSGLPKDPSPLRNLVRSTLRESRMPTELIQAMPKTRIANDIEEFDTEATRRDWLGYFATKSGVNLNPRALAEVHPEKPQSTLRHELGHAVDHTLSPGSLATSGFGAAVTEGIAVGFDDRYMDSFIAQPSSYERYTDDDWRAPSSADAFKSTRDRVRDTGEMRLPNSPNTHMGQQFQQQTLFGE